MSPREGRFYESLVWSISSALFFAGVCLTILMWTNVIGPFRFLDLSEEERSRTVGLWLPGAPARAVPADTTIRLNAWRRVLPEGSSLMASHSLESLIGEGVGILAVPDGRNMTPEDADALTRFLIRGGGAILTGSVGVRSAAGEWRGYDLMRKLLRVRWIRPVPEPLLGAVSAWHRGPLSSGLRPGEPIELILEPGAPTISSSDGELRWGAGPGSEWFSASLRRSVGQGRLLWLAAGPESAMDSGGEDFRPMVRLIRGGVAWVGRFPSLELLAWPSGARFAAEILPARADDEAPLPTYGFAVAERIGGMTRLEARPELEERNRATAETLERRGAWVASHGKMTRWREIRRGLRANQRQIGERRLRLDVSNLSERPARDVVIRLHVNRPIVGAEIEGTTVGQTRAGLRLERGQEAVDVVLPELPPLSSRGYTVDLEWPDAAT